MVNLVVIECALLVVASLYNIFNGSLNIVLYYYTGKNHTEIKFHGGNKVKSTQNINILFETPCLCRVEYGMEQLPVGPRFVSVTVITPE